MLFDVVVRRRRALTPAIHAASHADREKKVAWFYVSMPTCGSVPKLMVSGRRSSAVNVTIVALHITRSK